MNPGSAAMSAPTTPPAIVKNATSCHAGLPQPVRAMTSLTNENTSNPIGNGISMGWIGCEAMLAGVFAIAFHLARAARAARYAGASDVNHDVACALSRAPA